MSICYGIITEHGGTITVRNGQPRGATFAIELPFQVLPQAITARRERSTVAGREGRILLLDQDPSVLEAVGAILRGRNHFVQAASTLQQAKSELAQQSFEVVIADLHVSERGGGETLSAWLESHQPVLLQRLLWMRASAPGDALAGEPRGGLHVLQKPFKAGDLLAVVEAVLSDVHAVPVER